MFVASYRAQHRAHDGTGQQILVSNAGTSTNDELFLPFGIAVEESGRILVADYQAQGNPDGNVIAVDPGTGEQTVLSDNTINTGTDYLFDPEDILVVPELPPYTLPVTPPSANCGETGATVVGTEGANGRRGTGSGDVIAGLGGADIIRGLGKNDRLCGGAGRDKLIGGRGRDRLIGGAGHDTLRGGPAATSAGRPRPRRPALLLMPSFAKATTGLVLAEAISLLLASAASAAPGDVYAVDRDADAVWKFEPSGGDAVALAQGSPPFEGSARRHHPRARRVPLRRRRRRQGVQGQPAER